MATNAQVVFKEGMHFEGKLGEHSIAIDAAEQFGGTNKGPTPKPLLLIALGGCTGMDVVSILDKMKVKFEHFEVDISAESTEEHPKYYKTIKITYMFKGENIPYSKVKKAIELSQEKYCGVSAMLGKAAEVNYEIKGDTFNYDA